MHRGDRLDEVGVGAALMADDTPPPMAPADIICISITKGNTTATALSTTAAMVRCIAASCARQSRSVAHSDRPYSDEAYSSQPSSPA